MLPKWVILSLRQAGWQKPSVTSRPNCLLGSDGHPASRWLPLASWHLAGSAAKHVAVGVGLVLREAEWGTYVKFMPLSCVWDTHFCLHPLSHLWSQCTKTNAGTQGPPSWWPACCSSSPQSLSHLYALFPSSLIPKPGARSPLLSAVLSYKDTYLCILP